MPTLLDQSDGLVSSPKRAVSASAYGYQQPTRKQSVVAVCREATPTHNKADFVFCYTKSV